jgi:Transferrin receptor-like dimerisation domain
VAAPGAKVAKEHGAKGLIIYSDPEDDGFGRGPVFPNGPWKDANGIQRGSIEYIFEYPGDPLTPGAPSTPETPRLDPSQAINLPKIPTTPLSYGDAKPMLDAMTGPEAPKEFRGGLPFTYHVGPGPAEARLNLDIAYEQERVNNVVVEIPGAKHPEEKSCSAATSTAGHAAPTTTPARGRRSCRSAAASAGCSRVAGDPTGRLFSPAGTARSAACSARPSGWSTCDRTCAATLWPTSTWTALAGVGSVPERCRRSTSSSRTYRRRCPRRASPGERFFDPGYQGHQAASRMSGKIVLRLASADALPFRYSEYASAIEGYVRELQGEQGAEIVDLEPLVVAAQAWGAAAGALAQRAAELVASDEEAYSRRGQRELRHINRSLGRQERALTRAEGLAGRPWFKHMIYAPGG